MRVAQFSNRLWKNPLLLVVILATWQSRCSEKSSTDNCCPPIKSSPLAMSGWFLCLLLWCWDSLQTNFIQWEFSLFARTGSNFTVCNCCDNPRNFWIQRTRLCFGTDWSSTENYEIRVATWMETRNCTATKSKLSMATQFFVAESDAFESSLIRVW